MSYWDMDATTAPTRNSPTPWGPAQTATQLADGIVRLTTANHGGLWLSPERWASLQRAVPGFVSWAGDPQRPEEGGWLEEDQDAAIARMVFGDDLGRDPRSLVGDRYSLAKHRLACVREFAEHSPQAYAIHAFESGHPDLFHVQYVRGNVLRASSIGGGCDLTLVGQGIGAVPKTASYSELMAACPRGTEVVEEPGWISHLGCKRASAELLPGIHEVTTENGPYLFVTRRRLEEIPEWMEASGFPDTWDGREALKKCEARGASGRVRFLASRNQTMADGLALMVLAYPSEFRSLTPETRQRMARLAEPGVERWRHTDSIYAVQEAWERSCLDARAADVSQELPAYAPGALNGPVAGGLTQ